MNWMLLIALQLRLNVLCYQILLQFFLLYFVPNQLLLLLSRQRQIGGEQAVCGGAASAVLLLHQLEEDLVRDLGLLKRV